MVMPPRRADAPRLIDWTGERCVPWAPNVQVVYEHYHRYLWARELVTGRKVLDLGSGEGFGSALLRDVAREVVGIDVDERTVEHSQLNYAGPGLEFRVASATDLSDFPDDSFEAVVAFEVIEHIRDQEAVLSEVARVLAPGGVVIMSTPDRHEYSEATGQENPFHERELSQDEFRILLGRHFRALEMFAQRTTTGSRIDALSPGAKGEHLAVQIERAGDEWRVAGPPAPLYVIAVASDAVLPELPSSSALSDFGLGLRREEEVAHGETRTELAVARASAKSSSDEAARLHDEISRVVHERDDARRTLAERPNPDESVVWRLLEGARRRFYGAIGGRESRLGRLTGASLRMVGRRMEARGRRRAGFGALTLPVSGEPDVSIVIPVHNQAGLTERCLKAIAHSSEGMRYEVIVVDDAADSDTKTLLAGVTGVNVLSNAENVGFLQSTNRGAAAARGRHIVLLNNDTEPQPGWLRALVDRAESAEDIGVVGAKLVYPDGRLQEAGGIVWREGEAWNFGNGEDPGQPEYNYVREVDYCSAAAMLVRAELWQAVGGFDKRYAPGYYEDADLCFAAREQGWRVMYEPKALVMHVEGGAMGTDEAVGGKRYQVINRPKFVDKWREALKDQAADPAWEHAHAASDRCPGPVVLVVDHRVPAPDRDAGSQRMWRILEAFKELGCRVTLLPDDGNPNEPYTSKLQAMGVEVLAGPIVVPERIAGLGSRLSLALVSRPYVAPRYLHLIREFAPRARIAYDTVDLHFLREERRSQHDKAANPKVAEVYRELELALGRAADVMVAVSADERAQLLALAPELRVEVVPMANDIAADVPGPDHRAGLLFVGGFEHLPNIDAAVYMAGEVMPRVWRSEPGVTLTIVGSHAPAEVTSLESDRIEVPGWVEDLQPLLRESLVMVAPLRFGAGMKGKVTQSLGAGLPVVTTTIGAEGLDVSDGEEMLIADDPEAFAERIVSLHRDPARWRRLSENGQALAERVCSPRVQREALERLLFDAPAAQESSATKTSWSPAPR
jgi:GT2 family glycosyltransferase/SAM-dependent methyltransferase/glycosyltransferase involved in cell wall biosynthesis